MKTERNILVAFLLNLAFSVLEFAGGVFTGSVAILSDAIHDLGDACSIGFSWFLERKSKRKADETHTYGYGRYSVLGGVITSLILLVGSGVVICNAAVRLISPKPVNYDGMLVFAVVGVAVNLVAAYVTHGGQSLNQRAVNLHMLEDVLGWAVVLIGALVMRFTRWVFLDPVLSIGVAAFILVNAARNLIEVTSLFLEKTPHGINVKEMEQRLMHIHGILGVHHIHIRSWDGQISCATMHIVAQGDPHKIKMLVRAELKKYRIVHATLELETENEPCEVETFQPQQVAHTHCHHH